MLKESHQIMKNVYFVQVDVSVCTGTKTAYLPYTAGILVASAWTSEIVRSTFCFKELIFLREEINDVVNRIKNPKFVGFSNYCWNTEYNKMLASAIKKKYPDCIIVFGGHNVPDDFSFLENFSYIDVLCHGEGEDTIKALLEAVALGTSFENVNNISFKNSDGSFVRTETKLQATLDYPSPYLEGWFDDIFEKHPDFTFNAILETSRGCPHQCAYCDWGLLKSKTRLFPLDRVKAEIKWMADHKIAFVWGADANFGMFKRDLEIADELVRVKEETGYPERMRMNYAKNNFENIFEIVKKFKECEFDRNGATLSFQSMSPVVLENIGRKNTSLDFYKNLLAKYNAENMKTYSELILGLPGETYRSFIEGIGKLFEIGQHFVFDVYGCILLPNSIMGNKDYMKKHGIKTVNTEIVRWHSNSNEFTVAEYNNLVIETNTMSRQDWVKAMTFSHMAKALHGNGLLRVFAIYLFYEKKLPYETFYDSIIKYFEDNPDLLASKIYFDVKNHVDDISLGIKTKKLIFPLCGEGTWDDHEYVVLNAIENMEQFYADTIPFLQDFGIATDVFKDLLLYQKTIIRKPFEEEKIISFNYDIHSFLSDVYINNYSPLQKKKNSLKMRDSSVMYDWVSFGKFVIWYGKMGWSSYKDEIQEIGE